ncbi:sulfite exporter TauE/SafE family protein [Actinokineospora inagensis]|uniref:sulfite exporter TauE/SafE family protein n=1 Tax=Actinokineospora inagensis TaxID=103730 RepID=UPI00047C2CBA|nr:sulfite exporter TauE/SafE family protein [Actinokineospora inagensis]
MSFWQGALVFLAGLVAGGINVVVGSGTLITFPVLLAVGYPPVVANVSNGIGLVSGSVSGAIGYREHLVGQRPRLLRMGAASLLGGVCGAVLLLVLPPGAFETIVPVLIAIALVLVIAQPWLARKLAERQGERHPNGGVALLAAAFVVGIYGGYFGAAQGILLLGCMGILLDESLHRINAVKNVLAALVNLSSGIVFVFVAHVAWWAVLLIAVSSTIGGVIGAKVGKKLPPTVLRGAIVLVGTIAILQLLLK